MKNKKIGIIIMAAVLCALALVLFFVSGNVEDKDGADTGESVVTHAVSRLDAASIKTVSYTNKEKEYSFTLEDGGWKYDADEKFPLDTKSVTELAEALSEITADKVIEGKPTDSAEYGLDTPAHTVRVVCIDGTSHTYKIGDYNRHSGLYYLSYDKSDKVYLVSSSFASVFTLEEEDFLVLEKMDSITADAVSEITAEGNFGKITLAVSEGEGESKKIYTHTNAQGGVQTLDAEGALKIIKALCAPSLTKCADYCAEGAELDAFGLSESERVKVTVSYTAKITTQTATGGEQISNVGKTCVYYIGRAEAELEAEDQDATDTSADTAQNEESKPEKVEKTYLVLENSNMVFDVDMSAADAMFEK